MKLKRPFWWKTFLMEYFRNGGNATKAYHAARPDVKLSTANRESSKLMANPQFSLVLAQERAKRDAKVEMTEDIWLRHLVGMATAKVDPTAQAKLNALEMLGKKKGFIAEDRKEATINFTMLVNAQIEAMQRLKAAGQVVVVTESIEDLQQAEIEQDD